MDYIQPIKKEFQDKTLFQTWEMVHKRAYDIKATLLHPCSMKHEHLRKLIPKSFPLREVLELLPLQQKQIARRLNIPMLPSDRSSGLLGQSALFEILRNRGYDFRSYLDNFIQQRYEAQLEGHVLLFTLGYLYYIRRYFGYPPIDLVKYLIESISNFQLVMVWDENWYARIMNNVASVTPNNLPKKHINQVIRKLVRLQDGWGATVTRVMEWTGLPRADATHILDLIRAGRVEHRYRIVSKNTGTVKVLAKSRARWKSIPSFFSYCSSLNDGEDYFISVTDIFKNEADGKYFDIEAMNTNIELYDMQNQVWTLTPPTQESRSTNDIYRIFQNGDHTIPDNLIPPTNRDMFFIALLTAMNTSHHSKKNQEIMTCLTRGYEITKEEAENGIRNVLRKNLLRNQYTHFAIMDIDREFYTVIFDDRSKRTIPFLGAILPQLPFFWIQTNGDMEYGHIFEYHPSYLSCDVRYMVESALQEHDVNGELFVVRSWGFGHPGSILQLVDDE
ncbi:MAG: hypothetical protein ACFFEF_06415 [Candidatus Thorarchaeota archaeon]